MKGFVLLALKFTSLVNEFFSEFVVSRSGKKRKVLEPITKERERERQVGGGGERVKYLRPAASGCINAGCAAVDDALGVGLGLLTTIICFLFGLCAKVNARKKKEKSKIRKKFGCRRREFAKNLR